MPRLEAQGPFIGVNRRVEPGLLRPGEAADALNLVIDGGRLRKRPGWIELNDFRDDVEDPPNKVVQGVYDYQQIDGTILPLFVIDGLLYKLQAGGFVAIPDGSSGSPTLSTTKKASFVTANNRVYYCADSEVGVTDGTNKYKAVIPRPATPTVTVIVGAGNLNGTYDYKITFYSTTWGQESAATDVSVTVSPSDENVKINNATAAPDARVDRIRVYRRKVSVNESVWSLVVESSTIVGDITDSTPDVDADALKLAPLSYSTASPKFRYLAFHQGGLFAGGIEAEPNNLYFGRPDEPWTLGDVLQIGSGSDNDPITSIHSFQGVLVVGKAKSIWTLSGNTRDTFVSLKLVAGKGVRSHWSVIEQGGRLYYLGEEAFYAFDGRDPVDISSEKILPLVQNRNVLLDREVVAVDDLANGAILWAIPSVGATTNDQILAFFYRNSGETQDFSWCPWQVGNIASMGLVTNTLTGVRSVYYGFTEGIVAEQSGDDDDSQPISFFWLTGRIVTEVGDRLKVFRELALETDAQATGGTVDISYALENQQLVFLASHDLSRELFRTRVGRSGRELALEFRGSSVIPTSIRSWSLDWALAGRQ